MKALDVAAHVINHGIQIGKPITNLKLQKILYFLDITYLANVGERLLDEEFEARFCGPVIGEVYEKYLSNAASPIYLEQPFKEELPVNYKERIVNKIEDLITTSTFDLVDIYEEKYSPWSIAKEKKHSCAKISEESIHRYVKKIKSDQSMDV